MTTTERFVGDKANINKGGIYKVFFLNGNYDDCYIGSCKNILRRCREHYSYFNMYDILPLKKKKYVDKYGFENLRFSIIELCDNHIERIMKEKNWIYKIQPKMNSNSLGGFKGEKTLTVRRTE